MRRGLAPSDLGDLFDQPRAAVISMSLPDGRIFSRPMRIPGQPWSWLKTPTHTGQSRYAVESA